MERRSLQNDNKKKALYVKGEQKGKAIKEKKNLLIAFPL